MTTKTIYWIIGGVAIAVGGYFAYKHFTKESTSDASGKPKKRKNRPSFDTEQGGCPQPTFARPSRQCKTGNWVWDETICGWRCVGGGEQTSVKTT